MSDSPLLLRIHFRRDIAYRVRKISLYLTANIVGATIGRLMNAECRVQNAEWRVRLRKGRKDTPPKLQMQFRRDMAYRVRKVSLYLTANIVGATIGRLMNAECRVQNAEWRVRLRKGRKDTPPKLQMQFRRDMACRVRKVSLYLTANIVGATIGRPRHKSLADL